MPHRVCHPAQVNYVGKGCNLLQSGYVNHGSASVITKFLNTTWLWDRVRVSGGAYGGFCGYDSLSGMYTCLSYRDPNLLATLDNYDAIPKFLKDVTLDEDALSKAIIGAIGAVDAHQLPPAKGYTSLLRHLLGLSDDLRQQRRDEILSTTAAHFREFGEALRSAQGGGRSVVVGSDAAVRQANQDGAHGAFTVRQVFEA